MIRCEICGQQFDQLRSIGPHLQKHRPLVPQEYYDRYLRTPDAGRCQVCGSPTKFISLTSGYQKFCGRKCSASSPETRENFRSTCRDRYGVDAPGQSSEIRAKASQTKIDRYGNANFVNPEKRKMTCLDRYGDVTASRSEAVKQKQAQTNLDRYGAKCYLSTAEGIEKSRQTLLDRYGVDNPMKSSAIRAKSERTKLERYGDAHYHNQEKAKATCLERYGVDNPLKLEEIRDRAVSTLQNHYGVSFPIRSEQIHDQIRRTMLDRYGVEYSGQSPEIARKMRAARIRNGTNSKIELSFEDRLRNAGVDFEVEYQSDLYPFRADFYLPEKDLYLELNIYWHHGGHWFSPSSSEDQARIDAWKQKQSKPYLAAIDTWTRRDVEKREAARAGDLNYVVLWTESDIDLWFSLDCPIGKDWDQAYTWLPDRKISNQLVWKELNDRRQRVTDIAKKAQFFEFFHREIELWNSTEISNPDRIQVNLYANRLRYIGKNPNELSDLEILRGLNISGKIRAYSTFDNTGMLKLINDYAIRSIYDPCAGWGERLLTCAARNIRYAGVDINANVVEGLERIIDQYHLDRNQYQVRCGDSGERSAVPSDNFDATFTCPPYWNTEIYTEKGAENLAYPDFLSWWRRVVKNSTSEIFAYQINEKYKEDLNAVLIESGYVFCEEIVLPKRSGHFTRSKNLDRKREHESIQVFRIVGN